MSMIAKEQHKLERTPSSDNDTINQVRVYSSSSSDHQNSAKKNKINIVKESQSNIEESLIDLCESTKILENVSENLLDTSTEEQTNSKEIEILNINSDVSIEKSMPNVTSSGTKSLASSFINKSSSLFIMENGTKSEKKELNKKRRSRESTEIAIKHDDLSKEIDSSQEKMDISIESLNSTSIESSIAADEIILSQHDNIELVDKITNKDETTIENINICNNENATEVISESNKIDKKECIVIDNKNSNKIESDKVDKTSRLSISLAKSTQIENTDDRKSFTSILITGDDNEKLTLEERSLYHDKNEVSSNMTHSEPDESIDLQILSPINESSDDRIAVTQSKVIDNSDSVEEKQENLSECTMESTPKSSSAMLETDNFTHDDSNDVPIQDQSSDIIEISRKSVMDISPEKTAAKDVLPKKVAKRNLKQKSTDVDGNLQMKTNQKDQKNDDVSDVEDIDLFQHIPIDKQKEKNDVKIDLTESTSQSVEKIENDNEDDLILMNKQAWLAAEIIKVTNEAESFEDDSNDTVLLKNHLDATQMNYNTKKLDIVDEELLMDINSKENEKRKSKIKRLASEIDQDSSGYTEDENNLVTADKSFTESKTALNPNNDQFMSRLNKSEQSARTRERFSKINDELDKEIENDTSKLNRSSLINKKDTFLEKSMERRASLNKSSKDSSMQNVFANKSLRINDSEEELDTDTHIRKKLYRKKCLNKSHNEDADDNTIESEIKNMSIEKNNEDSNEKNENASLNRSVDQKSKPIDTKTMIYLNNDDESDDSDINIVPMDFGSKTYSMIANASADSSDQNERDIPSYLFAKSSDSDDNSSDSDINREYNLDGVENVELKFSDDDVLADECRTSEIEFSDPDDNGSDLADFIVDDDAIENEEKNDDDDDIENEEEDDDDDDDDIYNMKDDESENEQNIEENDKVALEEKVQDEENKQACINTQSINTKDKNEKNNEDIQEKDHTADTDLPIKKKKKKSLENEIKFSTPNSNNYKKLEFDESISENKDTKSDSTMKVTQNILVKKKKSKEGPILNKDINLKKFDYANKEKSDFSPDLLNLLEKTNISKLRSFKTELHKTMNIVDTETPTIKHLRKEKLNESVPTLKLNAETSSLSMKKLSTERKDNKNEVSDLIMLSNDDVIQKQNQKKLKKYKKQDTSKKNTSDEILSKSAIKLNVSKKKKPIKLTTQLTIRDDNIHEDVRQVINKKKKKKQSTSKENIIDKTLSEDAIELKISKKKKLVKHPQLIIINDNIHEDVCQISEKKKKKRKQDTRENIIDKALSEDTVELKIPKKKKLVKFTQLTIDDNIHKDSSINEKKEKKKKKKQETSKENIIDEAYEDVELKIPKKKKCTKFIQSTVKDNTREDTCQINEKEKQKKKQKTSEENIAEKALFEDAAELKIPKKKKRAQLSQLAIIKDNTCKDAYHINEKKKKRKKEKSLKENITEKALAENEIELKISKKKYANFNQLTNIQDNIYEHSYQINEKEKKKNKKQMNIVEDENVNEDNILRKNIREKTELAQQKKKKKIIHSLKLDSPTDEPITKKKKPQKTVESIETLWTEEKKNTLPVQIPVLKLKANKNLLSRKLLRKTALDASESRNIICTKTLDEDTTNMCIPKELKPKKKRDQTEDIENLNIPNKKSKKEVKEMTKFLPSSSGVKRLPDNVIENLVPRPRKKRKVSRNEERVVKSSIKDKSKVTDCDNLFTLNTSGCTTQFHVVNLQTTKKQSSKGAAASFRQRVLAKNKREPISAYMMYHNKMDIK